MAEAKLTAAQKNEIFHRAIFDGLSDAQLAEEYGVCRKTIYRITHDKKRIERKRSTLETMRELAKLRVLASAERAAQKQIELMDRQVPESMLYINQNAAVDIMNRAGIRQEAKDTGEVRVVFGDEGLTVNMPQDDEKNGDHA